MQRTKGRLSFLATRFAFALAISTGLSVGLTGLVGESHAAPPNRRAVVAIVRTPSGDGYWVAANDGTVSNFGDARFYGGTQNLDLPKPVVGMAATPTGQGYWLVTSDGRIFSFGDAVFYGSPTGP